MQVIVCNCFGILLGSATADVDFHTISLNLTFPTNSMNGDIQCLNVTVIDDLLVEGEENFILILTLLSSGNVTVDNDTITLFIEDDEGTRA